MKKLLIACLIAGISVCGLLPANSADNKTTPAQKDKGNEPKATPFHGKIDALDKAAKSIKVGERTFYVVADTKLTKAGKMATFEDAKVGEEVGGAYYEGAGGKLQLTSLRIGPKPEAKKKVEEKK
jgi:hypothetical protein